MTAKLQAQDDIAGETNVPAAAPRAVPCVCICVPTYNGEAHLVECFESIRAQTLGDFEVIVVDDNSSDRSYEIAQDYARRDPRFRVHRNSERLGLAANWNRCLELSRGEWIKLLFQDDLIESRCLERLVNSCRQRGKLFGFCRRRIIFDGPALPALREFFATHQEWLTEVYGRADSYMEPAKFARLAAPYWNRNLIGEPTVTLIHRSLFQKFGLFIPAMIQMCDSEYWIRLATNVGVVHVAEELAAFRVHGKSTTSHNLSQREYAIQYLDPLVERYLFLHENHYAAFRKELFQSTGRLVNWWRLIWTAHEAKKIAAVNGADCPRQWNAIVAAYPRLKTLALIGGLLGIVRSGLASTGLDRHLKKRTA